MLSYCLKCNKNKASKNPRVSKSSHGKIMLLSKFALWDSKTSKFIKEQEASGLLIQLGIRAPLSEIPLLGDILF